MCAISESCMNRPIYDDSSAKSVTLEASDTDLKLFRI